MSYTITNPRYAQVIKIEKRKCPQMKMGILDATITNMFILRANKPEFGSACGCRLLFLEGKLSAVLHRQLQLCVTSSKCQIAPSGGSASPHCWAGASPYRFSWAIPLGSVCMLISLDILCARHLWWLISNNSLCLCLSCMSPHLAEVQWGGAKLEFFLGSEDGQGILRGST